MNYRLGRAATLLTFCIAAFSVSGCYDLFGDDVQDEANADPNATGENSPPTISGNPPPAVNVGDTYSFTPSADDPEGDPLSFSIENQPNWLEFDPSTGNLTGVATLGNEGRYEGIMINASDGDKTSSLGPFAIEITQVALGSATLSWTPPTENTDGSPLMDLSAYKIYWGTTQGVYVNSVRIDNPGISTYVVENLVPNTYYFVATSINGAGEESSYSNVAMKIVNSM